MDIMEAMAKRHSVRNYLDTPLEGDTLAALEREIAACNAEGGLHIQLVRDEPRAFDSTMAHYGKFSGVKNYLVMAGKKGPALEELCGYYGERIVLLAETLGLNTCWVALTYKKIPDAFTIAPGEKLTVVIAVGYGAVQGAAHKGKTPEAVSDAGADAPDWLRRGVEAALLAPTAMNQQKFRFSLRDGAVSARPGLGFYTKIDLGIAKYHFELGAGKDNFAWV